MSAAQSDPSGPRSALDAKAADHHAAGLLRPDPTRSGRRGSRRALRRSLAIDGAALAVQTPTGISAAGNSQAPARRNCSAALAEVERRNEQQYQHALAAIASIDDERSILPEWREQGWLDQHTVAIIAVQHRPWLQVAVTNGNRRALGELQRRGATVDNVVVPTRFHAQVLAHAVMVRQQAWRIHPAAHLLTAGRTQAWMADAPTVDLAALAAAEASRSAAVSGPAD